MRMWLIAKLAAATYPAAVKHANWTSSVLPYVSVLEATTSIDISRGTITAKTNGGDALANPGCISMSTFKARRNRWRLIADLIGAEFSPNRNTPGVLDGDVAEIAEGQILMGNLVSW